MISLSRAAGLISFASATYGQGRGRVDGLQTLSSDGVALMARRVVVVEERSGLTVDPLPVERREVSDK